LEKEMSRTAEEILQGLPEVPTATATRSQYASQTARLQVLPQRLIDMALKRTGDGRNNAGHWLACQLRDNAVSESEAETVLREFARACPSSTATDTNPYTEAEALQTLRNVFRTAPREAWKATRTTSDTKSTGPLGPVELPDHTTPPFKFFSELRTEFPKMNEPIIHGLLRAGETANIIAPPKLGKTWLVTDLNLCINKGIA
jgi:hypothetical protein